MSDPSMPVSGQVPPTDLSLPGPSYVPTAPAPQFLGLTPDPAAYRPPATQSGYAPAPVYPPADAGYADYRVYDPQVPAGPLAPQPAAYPPMPYPYQYQAPYQPMAGPLIPGQTVQTPYGTFVVGPKSKLAAGLLGIFLGGWGVGQFYRGNVGLGILQIVVTLVTVGFGALWGLIEGIVVLVAKPGQPSSLDSNRQIMA